MINFIFIHNKSNGLKADAFILNSVIKRKSESIGMSANVIIHELDSDKSRSDLTNILSSLVLMEKHITILVFFENITDCELLYQANIIKVLIPNLEWLNATTERHIDKIDQVWHKSIFSFQHLKNLFPRIAHFYTGFTSIDPCLKVQSNKVFGHFRGKSPYRHSNEILAAWQNNSNFPLLKFHFCPDEINSSGENINAEGWFKQGNILMNVGVMDNNMYYQTLSSCEILLCMSASEGFGHYINEGRAMGALVCCIDAPPMNELISNDCGMLIPPISRFAQSQGIRYQIRTSQIVSLVEDIMKTPDIKITELKHNARKRYLLDKNIFEKNIEVLLNQFMNLFSEII